MDRPRRRRAWVLALPLLGCQASIEAHILDTGASETDMGEAESGETQAPADLPDEGTLPDLPGDGDTGDGDGEPDEPPLYPGDRVHSPLTTYVRGNLASIRALAPDAPAQVFAKVGASSTVSPSTLHCFATGPLDLDLHELALGETLDFFLAGEAGTTTPFDRDTLAAEVGKTAGWVIEGDPSPLDEELAAIHPAGPSLALVHYGANDMQQGLTYASAMPGYYANMSDLLDRLIDLGVVPIVFGLSRRLDLEAADLWVQSYNAVARGLAQARSIPFVDLRLALEGLPGYGISGDGLHLEAFTEGACILTPEGLGHGYNVRNLIALENLTRVHEALDLDTLPDEPPPPQLTGLGDLDDPLLIPALPFTDSRSTVDAPSLFFDVYGCDDADESGPENVYRLELDEPTALRALVLDRAGVDVDVHLLDDSGTEAGCIARGDMLIETTVPAGTYFFTLDTYVNGNAEEQSGAYTFAVLRCEPADPDCL